MEGSIDKSTETLKKDLIKILSEELVLSNPTDLFAYRNDASWFIGNPSIVVLPRSTEEEIKEKDINVLVTTCPSCRLYLSSSLARHNHKCKVYHPLELL